MNLHRPIGIFDAGIGSYAIVERVRARFPQQDIVYFADRASFPYGAKTPDSLLAAVKGATDYLISEGCVAVILASNAPSVMVLEALKAAVSVPVFGIFPPVQEAIAQSRSKQVAILGVQSMIASAAMQAYIAQQRSPDSTVVPVNASALVELVENFTFLHDPHLTQEIVSRFIAAVRHDHPAVDVMTMSSTHLPWLTRFFQAAAPDTLFLDAADAVLEQVAPHTSAGSGMTRCIATETAALTLADFNRALRTLGVPQQADALKIQ